jgi:hypothetical protein
MELFTMGRGNYTESDVREAARAFTGWSYDKDAQFLERKKFHDSAAKHFWGEPEISTAMLSWTLSWSNPLLPDLSPINSTVFWSTNKWIRKSSTR